MEALTVNKLIEHLKTFDGSLRVIYSFHSEYTLMQLDDISICKCQPPRPDGHVASNWAVRKGDPKLPEVDYLLFPGN